MGGLPAEKPRLRTMERPTRAEYEALDNWSMKRIADLRVSLTQIGTKERLVRHALDKQLERNSELSDMIQDTQGRAFNDGVICGAVMTLVGEGLLAVVGVAIWFI